MSLPLRTLLVENSEDDALLLIEALRRDGYEPEFERVQTAATMRAALEAKEWDVVLCDYIMPNFDAPAALRVVQEFNPELPVIVVSGTVGEDIAVATIKLGAADYLMKDRLTRLGQAVGQVLGQKRLRLERRQADAALKESVAKIHSILSVAPVGIGRVVKRVLLEVNEALCQMLGYSREELNGLESRILYLTDEDYRATGLQYLQLAERNKASFETRFLTKDSQIIDVAITAVWLDAANPEAGVVFAATDISEHKRAEQALRDSEEKFAKAFRASPDAISVHEMVSGRYVDANPGVLRFFGCLREEIIGRSPGELGFWFDADERSRFIERLHREGSVRDFVARFNSRQGGVRVGELSAELVVIGERPHNVTVLRDITARLQAEQALRDSEEKFAKAFRTSPDAISISELPTGRILEVNDAFERFAGIPRDRIIGRTSQELELWDNPSDRSRMLEELRVRGSIRNMEVASRTPAGGLHNFLFSAEPVVIGGRPCLVVVSRDVTEQKIAERALRESEEKFAKAFRGSPYSLSLSDLTTGRYIDINHGFEQVSGYTHQEVIGRTSKELGFWLNEGERDELVRRLLEYGSVRQMEVTFRARDGRSVIALCNGDLIEVAGRRCILSTFEDITERRNAEQENTRLEAQLKQTQKLEALGTLAGGIAHDFNNILSAMIVYRELAVMDIDRPAELRKHLAEIGLASNRAKDLVRQILTFSRQQQQERRAVQLHPVVREALQLLRASLPATIEIIPVIDEQAPQVLADTSQVHQIMMNLATNAAHAMRDRPGRLKVTLGRCLVDEAQARLHPGLRSGVYVRLSIADTGHGMEAGTVARIFEPFFTTKGPGEGTGLGLSVVHGIMEDHDGAITVKSRPGEGTDFDLYFPEYVGVARAIIEHESGIPRGGGESVLVVDDETALCEAMRTMLEKLGYQVSACTNPVEAIGKFRAAPQKFDLLVTDHTMPRMTGLDVIHEVQRLRPELPVLLVSGLSGTWTPEKLRGFNIREIVAKPLDFAGLARAVHHALDHRRNRVN